MQTSKTVQLVEGSIRQLCATIGWRNGLMEANCGYSETSFNYFLNDVNVDGVIINEYCNTSAFAIY
ncbi:hypothetical protein NQ315_006857 [Exocentrus adspersus]|uniref:Uncharacterized protein n=1 Tax=Exocentrus adspersus TaxID=1586481 RepID=A0AAV8WBW9_9CUCU|nr:hypothetical protein NQ315_006857 [Exocentrus adspersus]